MLPTYAQTKIQDDENSSSPISLITTNTNLGHLPTAHAGLWFERFFNQYQSDFTIDQSGKAKFLDTYFSNNSSEHSCGDRASIGHFALRQQSLVAARNGRTESMQSSWHFATGLGNPHPLENGLQWHPVLGTPYLPGSGLKGVLRAWLELHELPSDAMLTLLGSESKQSSYDNDTQQAGELIFFDALPAKRVKLIKDTMTPHMGKWYELGEDHPGIGATLPADWHAPVPVPFMVAKDLLLQFSIVPRSQNENSDALLNFAMKALKDALIHMGAGAKTAAGYGHMQPLDSKNRKVIDNLHTHIAEEQSKAKEKARLNSLSPSQQILDELRKEGEIASNQSPNTGGEFHTKITDTLKSASDWSLEDRIELAEFSGLFLKKHASKKRKKEANTIINALLKDI